MMAEEKRALQATVTELAARLESVEVSRENEVAVVAAGNVTGTTTAMLEKVQGEDATSEKKLEGVDLEVKKDGASVATRPKDKSETSSLGVETGATKGVKKMEKSRQQSYNNSNRRSAAKNQSQLALPYLPQPGIQVAAADQNKADTTKDKVPGAEPTNSEERRNENNLDLGASGAIAEGAKIFTKQDCAKTAEQDEIHRNMVILAEQLSATKQASKPGALAPAKAAASTGTASTQKKAHTVAPTGGGKGLQQGAGGQGPGAGVLNRLSQGLNKLMKGMEIFQASLEKETKKSFGEDERECTPATAKKKSQANRWWQRKKKRAGGDKE
jgi:hypothetical protein